MNCEESLDLLSLFHDGELAEPTQVQVRSHLDDCPDCAHIFHELDLIVHAATLVQNEDDINFPDENIIWQRIAKRQRTVH